MTSPLDDAEFLVRSKHRVGVLQRLGESPCHRHELHAELDVPQSTLGRVLGDFQDRNWIRRGGAVYELSPLGRMVVDELSSMLETLTAVQRLQEVMHSLPTAEMDFDHRHFRDASVTTANAHGVRAVIGRKIAQVRSAEDLQVLTNVGGAEALELLRQVVVEDAHTLRAVFPRSLFDEVRSDAVQSELLREMLASGRADLFVFDGTFPHVVAVSDGSDVGICLFDGEMPVAHVQTDDERIRAWATDTFDRYAAQSTPISASQIAG
jgi:predicted transcriptional regulator